MLVNIGSIVMDTILLGIFASNGEPGQCVISFDS